MAKVDTRSHKHFVWDASVSTVLHPFVDHVPQESFLQKENSRIRKKKEKKKKPKQKEISFNSSGAGGRSVGGGGTTSPDL